MAAEEGTEPVAPPADEEPLAEEETVPVDSTAVASVAFNESSGEITVVWLSGSESTFEGDRATFESLTGAGSVGKAVNAMMGRGGKSA